VAVRLFVLYSNERNSPSFQQILSNFKDIVIYFKNYLLLNIAKLANDILIPLSMVVGVSVNNCNLSTRMVDFLRSYD